MDKKTLDKNTLTFSTIKTQMTTNPIMFAKLFADEYRIIEDVIIIRINTAVYATALNSNKISEHYMGNTLHYHAYENGMLKETYHIKIDDLLTKDWPVQFFKKILSL